MNRAWAAAAAALTLAAVVAVSTGPAAANHDDTTLRVTVAINAAGGDRLSVSDDTYDSTSYVALASDVALALDRPPGSFRAREDVLGATVELDGRLAQSDGRGRLSYPIDTGKLQLLALGKGYEAVAVKVCTPRVRQVVRSLVTPESLPLGSPGNRCRGWYQPVDEPAIRAVLQLSPDRQRYPSAVGRAVGVAAIAFGFLGIGATLLRRGPLRRRSLVSWLLSAAAALGVGPIGWAAATFALWWTGAPADPMLLGGGSVGEQVARTMVPGLVFLLPALLPAVVLLTVPRRAATPRPPPAAWAPAGPPEATWWPAAWWPVWAAQSGSPAGAHAAPAPPAPEALGASRPSGLRPARRPGPRRAPAAADPRPGGGWRQVSRCCRRSPRSWRRSAASPA